MPNIPTGSGFKGDGTPGDSSTTPATYPKSPASFPSFMPIHIPDPSLKGISFDQLLQNRGIRFIHRLAVPCANLNTVYDNSHDPNCQLCGGNGIHYYREKEIYGVFYSNSLEKNYEMQGVWEVGTAMVTLPSEYPDGSQAEFNPFDQLVIPDHTVRLYQMLDYEPKPNNLQQMRYPIDRVDYAYMVINGQEVELEEGTHFNVVDGKIQWIPGMEPPYDSDVERGQPYVVVYFANPVYAVVQHMRELRISQELNNGVKQPTRLPQQVLVKRAFLLNMPERTTSSEP